MFDARLNEIELIKKLRFGTLQCKAQFNYPNGIREKK